MPIERKLAAIMFTDIAGYTAQMSKDEAVAISLLNKKESILKPLIAQHNGTYVKSTGDGSLSHFNSAVDAATCAKRFQESIYDDKDLNVRVGVHLGDTIFEKGDIRGDGVNIASRLESMAVEGGVFVSKEVHDQLTNQKEFEGVSIGLQSMKGVGRLIEVYGLKGDKLSEPNPKEYQDNKIDKHSDDEVPSIAIIPFKNKGADEDVFYAYGISADLISDCSSAGLIRVASLERVEELSDLLIEEKAEKLDVRYIATGNLWKMDDMFQLSVELYDTKNKKIVWSDRWQENWDNLTSIKGNISDGLLKALDTKAKVEKKIETTNIEAYEYYLKGRYKSMKSENMEDRDIARGFLQKAIQLDDNLGTAKGWLGWLYIQMGDVDNAMDVHTQALKQAEKLGDKSNMGSHLRWIGYIYWHKCDYDKALDLYTKAIRINEELDDKLELGLCFGNMVLVNIDTGDYKTAEENLAVAMKIFNETSDMFMLGWSNNSGGLINLAKGDCDKALDDFVRSFEINKEIGHKLGIGVNLNNLGKFYLFKGDIDKALDYFSRSINISEKLGHKWNILNCLQNIGIVYYYNGDYTNAVEYLEKSLAMKKEFGQEADNIIEATTYLYLTYKHLGRDYDEKKINSFIKKTTNIEFALNYRLYQLLKDSSYIKNAYKQVQEKADNLEHDIAAKFLNYPIPKAIVEEWEKVK